MLPESLLERLMEKPTEKEFFSRESVLESDSHREDVDTK